MFERNRIDSIEQGLTAVVLTLSDGRELHGKITMPAARTVIDFINGPAAFIEFEPYDGEKSFVAKPTISAVRVTAVPRPTNVNQRLRDLDAFDPYQILSLERGASWDDTRTAYHRLAKVYHPDRYATAELPEEVINYLSGMARRVNAAYSALEASHAQKKQYAGLKQAPVYTSPGRA
jgi:DnaJ-domain-containing protein 1